MPTSRGNSPGPYYPVFLNIKGKKCLVVGGGRVAERKILSLLKAGGDVTVISPALTKRLSDEISRRSIGHIKRKYKGPSDIKGAFLVIAATGSYDENKRISDDASKLNIPVNVVDTPSLCTFIVPSVVKRGPLRIAISTSGASPAMAKAIRKELEAMYGKDFGDYLRGLQKKRDRIIKEIPDGGKRKRALSALAAPEVLKGIRKKHRIKV